MLAIKKLQILLLLLFLSGSVFSQRVNKIILSDKGATTNIFILLGENVVMNITQDGNLEAFGFDRYADRPADFNQRKLDEYTGRLEKYTDVDNESFRGKAKFIGPTQITYYASFEDKLLAGKIKSVGPLKFSYYNNYEDALLQGKIKSIGQLVFNYFTSFDNDAFKGKLKSAGNVAFTYFNSTDDKAFAGKVKSFNGTPFVYYSSLDLPAYRGSMRSGNPLQVINGITYQIRN